VRKPARREPLAGGRPFPYLPQGGPADPGIRARLPWIGATTEATHMIGIRLSHRGGPPAAPGCPAIIPPPRLDEPADLSRRRAGATRPDGRDEGGAP
jgi:hypothetical protein